VNIPFCLEPSNSSIHGGSLLPLALGREIYFLVKFARVLRVSNMLAREDIMHFQKARWHVVP
jgi:hypothetical protein